MSFRSFSSSARKSGRRGDWILGELELLKEPTGLSSLAARVPDRLVERVIVLAHNTNPAEARLCFSALAPRAVMLGLPVPFTLLAKHSPDEGVQAIMNIYSNVPFRERAAMFRYACELLDHCRQRTREPDVS